MFAILYRPELKEYDFGPGHPFRGDRYEKFRKFLSQNLPEDENYRILAAQPATDADLLLICRQEYIDFTRGYYRAANLSLSYPGQFFRFHSGDNQPAGRPGKLEEAARLIIGQAKMACDLVQGSKFKKVVSIGGGLHHAKPSYGEGFCLYNDVAFCGAYLLQKYKLDRILILDTDAHAGNGTSEYFYQEPKVLFIDLHQDPGTLYPGTGFADQIGSGNGRGFNINIPMPSYASENSYRLAFEAIVEPVVKEFKPQIIIRNGGTDPHFADGLTNLGLPVSGFRMIGEKVGQMAEICDGRTIDLIASGYNEKVLPYGWLALICGLAGIELEIAEPEPIPQRFSPDSSLQESEKVIEEVKRQLKDYWSCLR
ncbi:MAG: histone deacetylase family protein [Chloroflexi bacterium]|nr:histone deacetylase family protein [Chloroflexota bacterium]